MNEYFEGFLHLKWTHVFSVSMILFAVIDIVGTIPVIIVLRNKAGTIHSEKATVVSFFIMVIFLFLGEAILKLLGVDIGSFAIAGSIVIFILAMEMLLGINLFKDEIPQTASIVPLAFPLIAGTGTMTTLLSLQAQYDIPTIIIGIILNMVVVYAVLKNLHFLERVLGKVGLSILRKVFGIVLLAIAIKLFRTNAGI
ncbi:MAG: MarC family protein [Sphingobacteriales bacterium]|nr:MAG: MarC family protein [Sphingobacteriales bacterium]